MSAESVSRLQESSENDSYVAGEVRRHDRERFLSALFAPSDRRQDLWALYAFNIEIARIPESVSEPLLGRIKVQWWRDVLDAVAEGRGPPAGHPIAGALASAITRRHLTPQWLNDLLLAREAEFGEETFADIAAMEAHADMTAVRLAWLSLEVLGVTDDVSRDAARHVLRVAFENQRHHQPIVERGDRAGENGIIRGHGGPHRVVRRSWRARGARQITFSPP